MQWIYKQIILPRLTYGCLVWGHSLTNSQISKLESVERVALRYHAPMWKTTPTASLQILLNQKPSHLEITSVSIKTYIRCKDMFQNNHWDGIVDNISANSHLKTLKSRCHRISHEGTPLDEFHSNFMKEPYYSWNPPIRPTLTAVGKNDIDDYLHNFDDDKDDDNHDSPTPSGNDAGGLSNSNRMEIRPLRGDPTGLLSTGMALASNPLTLPGAEISQGDVVPQHLIPSGISNITQLTLDQFDNNYRLFAQKLINVESDLTIRVILLKNNTMFLNYTFKILGSSNIQEAIIASTCKVCTIFLDHATRGDTLLCSLGAGHTCVRNSIIRNVHVHNLVSTLNQIKDKTGLYILMEGSKYDWLEYASNDTINVDLFVTPKKTVINLTIQSYLADQWANKWENIKGHAQTKFWCTGPDPILASKLLNMSREHLGWCIQFFTGHGWWKKHLKLTNLCKDDICRLCKRPDSIESPIHLFTECTELSAIRQDLFNDPYPSQLVIHNQLCQVTEFALVGRVCDLINIDNNHFNVSSSE